MSYTYDELAAIFFAYSFLAWVAETAVATVKEKDFRNRGFAAGPFCFLYGFTGTLLTVFLQELKNDRLFLFLGSMAVATVAEWSAGKLLEGMKRHKWWDYSGKRWNIDGYVCLQYSLLWGLLGLLAVRHGNGLIVGAYHILPGFLKSALLWALFAVCLIDVSGSLLSVFHLEHTLPRLFRWNRGLQGWTYRLAAGLSEHMERRIGRSYPLAVQGREEAKEEKRLGFVQLFWLFLIGSVLGDVTETVFCRVTAGAWMSRSSLVWGPFSVVWGLAVALVTALLHKEKDKQEHQIFWIGSFLGGAYEYICSVFTELLFGKVFWDYSGMPFNLGGRINLLYCLFWGIAAVVWMKGLYPRAEKLIDWIQRKTGRALTAALMAFLALDIAVSALALARYDARANGQGPKHAWERAVDERFDDARMERIYPNAIVQ